MSEDIEVYMESSSGACYLESLVKTRVLMDDLIGVTDLLDKLDEIISIELDLALIGSKKALSEVRKAELKDNNVTPIGEKK